MALREDEDTKLNPGQADYDQKVNNIAKAEAAGNFDDSADNSGSDSAREAEDNPNSEWSNNFTGQNSGPAGAKLAGRLSGLKKKGPIGLIVGVLVGGGFGLAGLLTPGLLLVQMKESLVDRLNTQLTSSDIRTNKILNAKINGTVSGICGGTISIRCKFASMSDAQVAKFKAAGIEIVPDKTTTITGRVKPKSFTFNGDTIEAKGFNARIASDAKFSTAVKQAYNPKYAGFADNIWKYVSGKLGIGKTKALPEGDAAAKSNAIADEVKSGLAPDEFVCDGNTCTRKLADGTIETVDEAAGKAANEGLQEAAKLTENSAEKVLANTSPKVVLTTSVGNFLKVTGVADTGCTIYKSIRDLGYAAKTVRAVQLARYAMIFLNTADQIKAGTATPEDVSYLGSILTSVAYDVKSGIARKSAMDSVGMQYVQYGDTGKIDSYAMQFMAGGGLSGDLITLTSMIENAVGANNPAGVKSICHTLQQPLIQAGSLVVGIVAILFPGTDVVMGASDVAKGVLSAAAMIALSAMPSMLKDIVAGTVTKGIVGEDAGNAIASGAGTIMGNTARAGGNGPMSVNDAIAYNSSQNEVLAKYAAEDRDNLSPLDATNKNTFLGSIVSKLLPSISQMSSLGGSLSALGSIISGSMSSIIPTSSALTQDQLRTAYTSCTDMDYRSLGIATDPFCNPVYGIPPQYLNKDPNTVISDLLSSKQINEDGTIVTDSDFDKFAKQCIDTTDPLNSGDRTDDNCIVNNSNADYYLYKIDQRISTGMDGYDTVQNSTSSIPTANNTTVVSSNELYTDSTSIACAAGTNDAGTDTGYHNNIATPIRLCTIPNTTDGSNSNQPVRVNSRVSAAFLELTKALATNEGVTSLHVADSFRTMADQQAAWTKYGAPRAAQPGYSNHQMGLAIDFQLTTGNTGSTKPRGVDKVFDWLTDNAKNYGIGQLPSEAWHWQPVGLN